MSTTTDFSWLGSSELTKGQKTKLRIIECALRLFGEFGFSNVTLKEIAEGSGTSHPLILRHFGDKNNLLFAVRRYVSISNHKWVDSSIRDSMSAKECIIAHCLENLKWGFNKPSEARIIILTYYNNSLPGNMDQSGTAAVDLGTQRILKYVNQAKREGLILIDEDPGFIASYIHDFLVGLVTKMVTYLDPKQKSFPRSYKKKLEIFANQLFSDGGG